MKDMKNQMQLPEIRLKKNYYWPVCKPQPYDLFGIKKELGSKETVEEINSF
jgi:hypothetical protein